MTKWKQVSGDQDFSGTGCTLARDNRSSRSVDLVRITPWLELDSDALRNGYGLWDVSTKTVDYEDMSVERDETRSALKTAGLDPLEYKKASPADKADVIAEHSGYEDSRSTSDFADALPTPIDQIEFWAKGSHNIAEINRQMRYEATQKLYGGSARKIPKDDALEFATNGEPFELDLDDQQTQGARYALAVASKTGSWKPPMSDDHKLATKDVTELKGLLAALLTAPKSKDLDNDLLAKLTKSYTRDFELDEVGRSDRVNDMIDEDAEASHELARTILGELGFI
jgi:hypothetical protein